MITFEKVSGQAAAAGCWTARIAGTLMALFFLAFVVGEGPPPLFRLTLEQNLHFLGLCALAVGLIAAWKWEWLGGLIAVAGYVLLVLLDARLAGNWLFVLPAAIGLMHVLCWLRLRGASPGRFPVVLWIAAGIFVLLCANEMFGTPPLMTPALRPSTMAGSWQSEGGGTEVIFAIHPDGSMAGRIGEAAFEDGRLTGNRSWFGRLMHWRTDYWIRGSLSGSGEKFSAPLNFKGEVLEGTVFVSDKPVVGRVRMRKLN